MWPDDGPRSRPTACSTLRRTARWSDSGRPGPSRARAAPRPPPRRESCSARSTAATRSEEHTSELQSQSNIVCRLLLEKKKRQSTMHRVLLLPEPIQQPPSALTSLQLHQPQCTSYDRSISAPHRCTHRSEVTDHLATLR